MAKTAYTTLLSLALGCAIAFPANAGWLSSLTREMVEGAGGAASRIGRSVELVPLKSAAEYLGKLKHAPKDALAAHATPEGHWQFVNRDGQTFTVGTPEEMKRVLPALLPDASVSDAQKMTLYLSEDSVFANRSALAELPPEAKLNLVFGKEAYPIRHSGSGVELVLKAKLSPNVSMVLNRERAFEETAFLLARPLNKSDIRTIALDPAATAPLSPSPKLDPVTKVPLVDQVNPGNLEAVLRPLRRQTALVTGRVNEGNLVVAPASGGEIQVPLDRLVAAARANDVNLIVLQSETTRQAGGRNWLWQKITIGGVDTAVRRGTFGNFLDALAERRGGFLLDTNIDSTGRVSITAAPDSSSASLSSDASNVFQDMASHVTGEVVTNAASIDARNSDAETDLDLRIIPWLPATIQILYIAGFVCGIAGWAMARKWWQWTLRAAGFGAALQKPSAIARGLSQSFFLLIFLPLVGFPAFVVHSVHQAIQIVLAPFRWIRRAFMTKNV